MSNPSTSLFLKKKGMSNAVIVLIIALVVTAVILPFSKTLFAKSKNIFTDEGFRLKVIEADERKILGEAPNVLPKERRLVTIFENKYKVQGLEERKFEELNKDTLSKVYADQLASCWYRFVEGKRDPFDHSFFGGNNICYVCSLISTDAEVKESDVPLTLPNFDGYLQQTPRKQTTNKADPSSSLTYWEYLDVTEHCGISTKDDIIPSGEQGIIDASQDYMVLLMSCEESRGANPWAGSYKAGEAVGERVAKGENPIKEPLSGKYHTSVLLRPVSSVDQLPCYFYN